MSRQLQIGDVAVVKVQGVNYPLKITGVSSSGIKVDGYDLIEINGEYRLSNYENPHTITFVASVEDLSPVELVKRCESREEVNSVCSSEEFWKSRLVKDFGVSSLPANYSARKLYRALALYNRSAFSRALVRDLIKADDMNTLRKLESFTDEDTQTAIDLRSIPALDVMKEKATSFNIDNAVRLGDTEIITHLVSSGFPVSVSREGFLHAARAADINTLDLIKGKGLDASVVAEVIREGAEPEFLTWLKDSGVKPDQRLVDEILLGDFNPEVMSWVWSSGLRPTVDAVQRLTDPVSKWFFTNLGI